MWDFVANHWDELSSDGDHTGLAYLLVRRLGRSFSDPGIVHFATGLGGPGHAPATPAAGSIQAAEMYIVPPIQGSEPSVGELFQSDTGAWLFSLTPSCDFTHREKLDRVLMAECEPAENDERVTAWWEQPSGSKTAKVKDLVKAKTGGQDDRWLFLPSAPTIPHLVVDFQRLQSLTLEGFDDLTRVASLASPFAEAAVNRFGRYYGRIGTDDLDVVATMQALEQLDPATP